MTIKGNEDIILLSSIFHKNEFMRAFLGNFSLVPACYQCPVKAGRSGSDITLGDFWGVEKVFPDMDDDKGCSLVVVYTERGERMRQRLKCKLEQVSYETVIAGNKSMEHSAHCPLNRRFFFDQCLNKGFYKAMELIEDNRLRMRIWRFMYRKIYKTM